MASSTFNHLPPEKKKRIMNAIMHELMRVPFSEISINKIIHEANISRGSFYQYFNDKYDCLESVMNHFKLKLNEKLLTCLKENKGDIFDMTESLFDAAAALLNKKETRLLYENLINDTKLNRDYIQQLLIHDKNFRNLLWNEIDMTKLNIQEDELETFLEILFAVAISSVRDIFFYREDSQAAKDKFLKKMTLLKKSYEREGIYA